MSPMARLLDAIGFWRCRPCDVELRMIDDVGVRLSVGCSSVANIDRLSAYGVRRRWNVYWGVNPRLRGELGGRHAVKACVVLHADIDDASPEHAVARLEASPVPPPTACVSSGNGSHLYWALDDPCYDLSRVEDACRRIARVLDGDSCWDSARILRVPGTTNFPCARKRAAGRVDGRVELVLCERRFVSMSDVESALSGVPLPPIERIGVDVQMDALDSPLSADEVALARALGYGGRWHDRSGADWELAVNSFFRGLDDDVVARLLWHAPWGKARERGLGYLRRTMERAKAHAKSTLEMLEA